MASNFAEQSVIQQHPLRPRGGGVSSQLHGRWRFLHDRVKQLQLDGHVEAVLDQAKWHLYCARYHGCASEPGSLADTAVGSLSQEFVNDWLTDLTSDAILSICRNLIEAENLLDEFLIRRAEAIDAVLHDFDGDGEVEVRLANSQIMAWLSPADGGRLYGLDSRRLRQSVLAVGMPSFLEYFWYPHIQSCEVGDYLAHADDSFALESFYGQLRQGPGRLQILLQQQTQVHGLALRIRKALTLLQSSGELEVTYLIEGLPPGLRLHFGSLWHWAGIGSSTTNRFVHDLMGHRLSSCQRSLHLPQSSGIGLYDVWSGVDLQLRTPDLCRMVVSATPRNGGSTSLLPYLSVMPHWEIMGDSQGRWATRFSLHIEETPCESRNSAT